MHSERHDHSYSNALDALNFEHLQQRLEREVGFPLLFCDFQ